MAAWGAEIARTEGAEKRRRVQRRLQLSRSISVGEQYGTQPPEQSMLGVPSHSIRLSALFCLLIGGQTLAQPPGPPGSVVETSKKLVGPPDPKVEKVRDLLFEFTVKWQFPQQRALLRKQLLEMREGVLPTFEVILSDPESHPITVRGLFEILISMEIDRSRFLEPTLERLTDENAAVRWKAVVLLGSIGSERDTAPVIALLTDPDDLVRDPAAAALVKLGGKRELLALDILLKSPAVQKESKDVVRNIRDCRNKLQERLNEKLNPKNLRN